ncbi:hypothetical protein HKX42_06255 [Salinisphaera sp. USBA-960]|nr:hypothetical protein [Salifodinibacter halophilus]NNC26475.1 hypothetical protein [Salifodinibacter halophilus]
MARQSPKPVAKPYTRHQPLGDNRLARHASALNQHEPHEALDTLERSQAHRSTVNTDRIAITVEPYGVLNDLLGGLTLSVHVPAPHDVNALMAELTHRFPAAASTLLQTAAAVDDQLIGRDTKLDDGQTVALLPPVSGGQPDTSRLTESPLDPASLMHETDDPAAGAVVVFGGTVRTENRDKSVTAIDYTAHRPLAESAMADIEAEIVDEPDVIACRIQHRLGRLEPGVASVYVVIRSGHREAAFIAGRKAIDKVKERVPIWKNEYFTDGTREYVPGVALDSEPT